VVVVGRNFASRLGGSRTTAPNGKSEDVKNSEGAGRKESVIGGPSNEMSLWGDHSAGSRSLGRTRLEGATWD
jgi:hypothetical protein